MPRVRRATCAAHDHRGSGSRVARARQYRTEVLVITSSVVCAPRQAALAMPLRALLRFYDEYVLGHTGLSGKGRRKLGIQV